MNNRRFFIERREDYSTRVKLLKNDLVDYLGIENLERVRIIDLFDFIRGESAFDRKIVRDILYKENLDIKSNELILDEDEVYFRIRYLEDQFNQIEDAANKLAKLITDDSPYISHSLIYTFKGVKPFELEKIKKYLINPVEMRELPLEKRLDKIYNEEIKPVEIVTGFKNMNNIQLAELKEKKSIGLDLEDLEYLQTYFKEENRDPSITEIRLIDTYWSDHCRHTTFMTELENIEIEENKYSQLMEEVFNNYQKSREYVFGADTDRPKFLMDVATINAREIEKKGLFPDKEISDEVNAASFEIDVDVNGKDERWILMFKNETHNHPTEIEPFGGAGTCLGGAIRDPLSGRSHVYQAMRITGAGDVKTPFEKTLEGKLSQRTITTTAADGYSSYGCEIGVGAGFVREIYDPGYIAKRMEVGALVAATKKENIYRGQAEAGDVIVLVGGKTGRDGVGGAVGSSEEHTEDSMEESGSEVQKGNPKIERKIMRLFRRPEVSKMIKVSNDFGAGGVSVAIGELAEGVKIDLDKVPLKYPGLDGTEVAISESQERMAVVLDEKDLDRFLAFCKKEDVEATKVAEVTEEKLLIMTYKGQEIVNIKREFLDTNGVRKKQKVTMKGPELTDVPFFDREPMHYSGEDIAEDFLTNMVDRNIASQKGLVELFDSSVGKGNVLSPLGGMERLTPTEGMISLIPVLEGETTTTSLMSYGFEPEINKWSQIHGGYYSVIQSVAKIVAMGGDYKNIRLSLQEYFERLEDDPVKWGKTLLSLLGAYEAQRILDIPAIGGKDSMSGSFEDLNVPPTLISFAVTTDKLENAISPEFKGIGREVGLINLDYDENFMLKPEQMKATYTEVKKLVDEGKITAISSIKYGGAARSIGEMALGNYIGFEFENTHHIFLPLIGSLVVELDDRVEGDIFKDSKYIRLGQTTGGGIVFEDSHIPLEVLKENYLAPNEEVFPVNKREHVKHADFTEKPFEAYSEIIEEPKVLIPIVPGTTGEYDLKRSYELAGAKTEEFIFKTGTKADFEESLDDFRRAIEDCHILAFPNGEIMGGQTRVSNALLEMIIKANDVADAINDHIKAGKLIIGIGAGFEALLATGLIKNDEVSDVKADDALIVENIDSKYFSRLVDIEWISESIWTEKKLSHSPVATRRGRIIGDIESLVKNNQIVATFAKDYFGTDYQIAALVSPSARVFGTLALIDRIDKGLYKNIPGFTEDDVIKRSVNYFKDRR